MINIRKKLLDPLSALCSAVLPFSVLRSFFKNRLTCVFYHQVTDRDSIFTKHLYQHRSIDAFERDVNFYKLHFNFVTLKDIVDFYEKDIALPPYALYLSFDDGHREMFESVGPFLKRHGIPATFFILSGMFDNSDLITPHKKSYITEVLLNCTKHPDEKIFNILGVRSGSSCVCLAQAAKKLHSFRDRASICRLGELLGIDWFKVSQKHRPYLTPEQIEELCGMGFDIGAHGVNHVKFCFLSDSERVNQIVNSISAVQNITNQPRISFSFPNSHAGVDIGWIKFMGISIERLGLFFSTKRNEDHDYPLVNRINMEYPLAKSKSCIRKEAKYTLVNNLISKLFY